MGWTTYEGMGPIANLLENIGDNFVPDSVDNFLSQASNTTNNDGWMGGEKEYLAALRRGENPPSPPGMPQEVVDENKSEAKRNPESMLG